MLLLAEMDERRGRRIICNYGTDMTEQHHDTFSYIFTYIYTLVCTRIGM